MEKQKTRILVFGTFDILHPGHIHFFRQARRLAKYPFLIVSVARDKNVKKIKRQSPLHNEKIRLAIVKKHPLVNKAVLGALKDYLNHIKLLKPTIIALGYDQTAYTSNLSAKLKQLGLKPKIKRLKPHKPHIYKSSKMKNRYVDR